MELANFAEKVEAVGHKPGSPVHSAVSDALVAMNQHNLSSDDWEAVLDVISTYGRNELAKFPFAGDDMWEEFNYGNVIAGDYVRVRPDAYTSETGSTHNGLVGVLLRVSGRRCSVRYLGRQAVSPMQHPIDSLMSMKRTVQ